MTLDGNAMTGTNTQNGWRIGDAGTSIFGPRIPGKYPIIIASNLTRVQARAMIESGQGYRYVIDIPMGFESATWTSKLLYPSRGAAIDAMRLAYPDDDYPDAKRSTMEDE